MLYNLSSSYSYDHVYYTLYISVNSQVTGLGISADQLLTACSINPPQNTSCQVSSLLYSLIKYWIILCIGNCWKWWS